MGEVELHRDAATVVVGGFDPSAKEKNKKKYLRDACSTLHCYIHNVGPQDESKIEAKLKVIVNKSQYYGAIKPRDIHEFHEILDKIDLEKSGIQKVIFAHSLGAKIVYEALKDESLEMFFNEKHTPGAHIKTRIQKIRDRIAIFTLGGVKKIPSTFSKIVRGFRFENDMTAAVGEFIIELMDQESNMKYRLRAFTYSASTLSASSSDSNNKHKLREYVDVKELKEEVVKLLNNKRD